MPALIRHRRRRMRADRGGKPQRKIILAMFAPRIEGFHLGGKLARKRLMRGDKSHLSYKNIRSLHLPVTLLKRRLKLHRGA